MSPTWSKPSNMPADLSLFPDDIAYAERIQARPRYKAAKAVDSALIAEMKK